MNIACTACGQWPCVCNDVPPGRFELTEDDYADLPVVDLDDLMRADETYAEPAPDCPACESPTALETLGTLGRRTHYRCRFCGIDTSLSPL